MFTTLAMFFEHVQHVLLNRCPSNYQYIKIKVKEFVFILFLCIFVFIICIMTMYVCIYLCLLKYKFLYEFTNRYINTHINMQIISSVDKKQTHTLCSLLCWLFAKIGILIQKICEMPTTWSHNKKLISRKMNSYERLHERKCIHYLILKH